jgi:hypothetical protein
MAYILGFWFTDGYMGESRCEISITQHKKDKYLLESILRKIGSSSPLNRHGKNSFQFRVFSEIITNDIKKYGGHQNKSYTLKFPNMIPKKYMSDFIRGCWDGDGSIWFTDRSKDKHGKGAYRSSIISASKSFIYGLLTALKLNINNFNGYIRRVGNSYVLEVGTNDTRKLGKYLYKDVKKNDLFLKRKKEKFLNSGKIRLSTHDVKFISCRKAIDFISKLNIKNRYEWQEYRRKRGINNVPSDPQKTYKEFRGKSWKFLFG